jgi:hypothetical protein
MANETERQSYATFVAYSHILTAQELGQLLPVQPDELWQKGAPRYKKNPVTSWGKDPRNVHRVSGVSVESRLDRSAPPEAHIDDLLRLLSPAKNTLRAFAQRARVEDLETKVPLYLTVVIETTRAEIGFDFPDEMLKAISDLGAHLGLELEFGDETPDE